MESRLAPLHSQRVCRFCLTKSEPLKYIYKPEHNNSSQVPLTVQINSCVGIEVSEADGMPQMICSMCRWNLDRFHKFRQQCKRADEALRYYPLSGVLPRPFPPISVDPRELGSKKFAETRQHESTKKLAETRQHESTEKLAETRQYESTKKLRTDNTERDRRVTRRSVREREKERERDRDRVNEKQQDKFLNEQRHNFYEEQDSESEAEQENDSVEHVKEDTMKLNPNEVRMHACDKCKQTFPLRQALSLHVQIAHRERKYKCADCKRRFFSKYILAQHISTHSKEKPSACKICQKQFARLDLLRRHEKRHENDTNGCQYCKREFLTKEDMQKHKKRCTKRTNCFTKVYTVNVSRVNRVKAP